MQDLFFENVMLVSPTGAFTPNINDDITVNVIRYNLKLKFDKVPNMINIWLYINIPQTTVYASTYIKNQPLGKPLTQDQMTEMLTCLFYKPKTSESVFDKKLLKPFKGNSKFYSYKWRSGEYKLLLANLKAIYSNINGIALSEYNKTEQQAGEPENAEKKEEPAKTAPTKIEVKDEELKKMIQDEFKQDVQADVFNKIKNITTVLADEVNANNGTPLKEIQKDKIKDNLKNLFTKYFDKKKEFISMLKKMKILDMTFDENNVSVLEENKISFYQELKNPNLFFDSYLKRI